MGIYVQFDGIKGSGSDKGHEKWMNVSSLTWGVHRNLKTEEGSSGNRESANVSIGDITISRKMDGASTSIFTESCVGTGKKVVIHLTKTGQGKGSSVYMQYTLKDALISKYTVIASSDSGSSPVEHITISFIDVEMKYTPYDSAGKAQAAVAVGYDTESNESR